MPASIADWGQSAAAWEHPIPERLQESPAVVAVGAQTRCLQNESIVMVAMLSNCKHGSARGCSGDPVKGYRGNWCSPCALGRAHGTLQPYGDESVIVGYTL